MAFLSIHKLYYNYRRTDFKGKVYAVELFQGLDLQLERGAWVNVCGPAGSGKTTLLRLIAGLDSINRQNKAHGRSGTIVIDGQNLGRMSTRARLQHMHQNIGLIEQHPDFVSPLNVLDNVALPLYTAGYPEVLSRKMARQLLERLELAQQWNADPRRLSTRERQRAAVARALVVKPPILLADEPIGSSRDLFCNQIMDLLRELNQSSDTIIVLTSHNSTIPTPGIIVQLGQKNNVRRKGRQPF